MYTMMVNVPLEGPLAEGGLIFVLKSGSTGQNTKWLKVGQLYAASEQQTGTGVYSWMDCSVQVAMYGVTAVCFGCKAAC
jgi:hypothetical protein